MSWGQTESRYDPNYHRDLGYSLAGWGKVGRIARVKGGKRIPLGETYATEETGLYYLRVDNLGGNGSLIGEMKWLTENTFDMLERYRVFTGDVLISIAGTIGRTAVFNEKTTKGPTILTENCAKLHMGDGILPQYLMLLLLSRPLQKQMERDYIQTTIPKLGLDRIRQLRIPPIPEISRQKRIIAEWEAILQKFEQTNRGALELLNSIDNYLLSELGITLPPEPLNTIANRIFTVRRQELAGWRFDARVYHYSFKLSSDRYPTVPLKAVIDINPRTLFRNVTDETMLTFLPMEAISDEDGSISSVQERAFIENIGYTDFQEGDLLWAKITPCMENGKSAVAENLLNGYGFGSTEYHVLRAKSSKIDIHYLHALLRIKRLRMAATNYFGGSSGHQRVDQVFFRRLEIPLPDIATQQALVKHIKSCREEAKNLRAIAKIELEIAKRRIEAILLGEADI
ncbi:MAG: restriction endonuclease subunit S [Methylobacter sp.]